MPNKVIDALAFCPFYKSEARFTITCEGIIGESTVSRFASEDEKKQHERDFCIDRTCSGCGVYSAIMGNYSVADRPSMRLRH